MALLIAAQRLGLNFERGTAYIRRSYIDEQDELNKPIKALKVKLKASKSELTLEI